MHNPTEQHPGIRGKSLCILVESTLCDKRGAVYLTIANYRFLDSNVIIPFHQHKRCIINTSCVVFQLNNYGFAWIEGGGILGLGRNSGIRSCHMKFP